MPSSIYQGNVLKGSWWVVCTYHAGEPAVDGTQEGPPWVRLPADLGGNELGEEGEHSAETPRQNGIHWGQGDGHGISRLRNTRPTSRVEGKEAKE